MTDIVLMRVKPGITGRSPRRRWHAAGTVLPMTRAEANEAWASGQWEEAAPAPPEDAAPSDEAAPEEEACCADPELVAAILGLDPDDAALWTSDGRPQVSALATAVGRTVTAVERDAAWAAVMATWDER